LKLINKHLINFNNYINLKYIIIIFIILNNYIFQYLLAGLIFRSTRECFYKP